MHDNRQTIHQLLKRLEQLLQEIEEQIDSQEAREASGDQTPASSMEPGPDYYSVRWDDRLFTFSPSQAAIVRILWMAWERGTAEVSQDYLLVEIDSGARRLCDLFRRNGKFHPAWGRMIVRGSRQGTYRLKAPDEA